MTKIAGLNNACIKKFILFSLLTSITFITGNAQVGIGTNTPNTSSVLDLTSTNKAFIPPRMNTVQRNNIANPVAGMVIFNTDSTCIEIYRSSGWFNICSAATTFSNSGTGSFAPVAVTKSTTQKVFAHILPWFETPASNGGAWGIHWTMANENPNIIQSNGNREIASNYYPLIGPYASGDTAVIDYQLLLMKLSGIDGVMIDWPGTINYSDFAQNLANTNVIISRLSKVGLKYSIVYEDNNLQYRSSGVSLTTAGQTDMSYVQAHYFTDPNYQFFSGVPLLLDFGPQQLTTSADWTTVFSVLSTKPSLFTIMFQSSQAGANAVGEFAWVEQTNITNLNNFYTSSYNPGTKISVGYPGFNSFYAQGGWPGPTWTIASNGTSTFLQTLTLALQSSAPYLQIATWNDYGEGTMIEPTDSTTGGFGYSLLTTLQQQLGVSGLSQSDLQAVTQLYNLRVANTGNTTALTTLNQVYYYIVSLQMDKAKQLLATF
jgi:hypothetical protein